MVWFKYLKESGYFNPENVPEPQKVKDGFLIPFWEPLSYLEKLSLRFKEGKELDIVPEILEIIKTVSEKPKDNYRTWYVFLKILSNIPNELIPTNVLYNIPTWLSGSFDTSLQSSVLCEKLLPKFLSDNPTSDDIKKAEILLNYLLSLERISKTENNSYAGIGSNYRSRISFHYLIDSLIEKKLTSKIVNYCSNEIIVSLAKSIKKLLLDYPNGIDAIIKSESGDYKVNVKVIDESLFLSILFDNESINTYSLDNIDYFNQIQLQNFIIESICKSGLKFSNSSENEKSISNLLYFLYNDATSAGGYNAISQLGEKHYNLDNTLEIYSWIFRELLIEKAKQNSEQVTEFIKFFSFNQIFQLPYFKRVSLYVIGKNWESLNALFCLFIENDINLKIFSSIYYRKELYELLNQNQEKFSEDLIRKLDSIIDEGPQDDDRERNEEYIKYWKLRWYSALRKIDQFKEKYAQLSQLFNATYEDFESEGEIKTRVGSISPLTKNEILEKSINELVDYIKNFNPKNYWDGPSVDGLGQSIEVAVEENPEKYVNEISLFDEVPYIYVYHILSGLKNAWKNNKVYNWEPLLIFCKSYISSEQFYSGKMIIENDSWKANCDWVVGAISTLLTEGMQSDKKGFELMLLPLTKEILMILVLNLTPVEDFEGTNMDYPTYSLNSTAGKTLRALLDYALRMKRNKISQNSTEWENELKFLFDQTNKKEIIDLYILHGMYFQQFSYLDETWIKKQVIDYYSLENKFWLAFFAGFTFGNAPFNEEYYKIFYPHYERAINNKIEVKSHYGQGIVRHLTQFYFWGYEDLNTAGLIDKFITTCKPNIILEFVNYIWTQKKYFTSLKGDDSKDFEKKIFLLWQYLTNKYEKSQNEEEQKILGTLSNFLIFASQLTQENTSYIIKSSAFIVKHFQTYYLIENLLSLKDKGIPSETAKYLSQILLEIPFQEYLSNQDLKNIEDLIDFMFQNSQKEAANEFCNKMFIKGYESFRNIYNKYNI